MNPRTLFLSLFLCLAVTANAVPPGDSTEIYAAQYQKLVDSVNSSLKYESGKINLEGGHATLNVPSGFKFLNKEQSRYVLTELLGNPSSTANEMVGMIFPENSGPLSDSSFAFVVTYSAIGYVKDEDANKIDYDELLKDLQKDEKEENAERVKQGYDPVYMIGWAQKPFYDSERKILHWAKELQFGEDENAHTLNYEIRILGRKGMLSLNAVSSMSELSLVNRDIPKILNIASFTEGNKYSDFNPDIDEVAAWTIGGLVAGKIIAKAGILAVILKFLAATWKFLLIALVPLGAWLRKKFSRKQSEEYASVPVETQEGAEESK